MRYVIQLQLLYFVPSEEIYSQILYFAHVIDTP